MQLDFDNALVLRIVRGLQALFAIIVLGTAAWVANWWTSSVGWPSSTAPSSVSFIIFCAVWTLVAVIYLVIVPWRMSHTKLSHIFVIVGLEALTMIFWFAGFIALAVFLGPRDCYGSVCRSAQAATVFGAFNWLLFAFTLGLATWALMRSRGKGKNGVGPESGAPDMSVNPGT